MAVGKQKHESALDLCLHFPPFLVHVALVLILGWISSPLNFNLPLVFTFGLLYLYYVEERIKAKSETKIRSEERRANDRKRLLSDAETARWLNCTVEAVWPIFLEKFASQKFLMSLAPWFLEKYKPWTAKKVVLQQICLGRSPPVFTMLRCGRNPTDGDHLVLEMNMRFVAATNMSAVIGVQMKKRVGLGLWTSLNISNVQIEGKLRVGVRFTRGWPVVERLRVCFSEAPILRMTAKPIINYGIDVTDLPGIASWIDKMIADALEQSLVEPNFLEVEVEKLVGSMMAVCAQLPTTPSPNPGPWFSVRKPKAPFVATLTVDILEGKRLKPSDPNGKADPYVKVKLGSAQYITAVQHRTLEPAWYETCRFLVESWDGPNKLLLRVRDKDRFGHDDKMGWKEIDCKAYKDGLRHEIWVTLDGVKTGQLQIAITVEEALVVEKITEGEKSNENVENGTEKSEISYSVGNERKSAADSQGHEKDQDFSDSDYESCPLKGEREAVDVGSGQLGAVSIVAPGKAEVKEATNPERLFQRRKQAPYTVQVDGDGRFADSTDHLGVGTARKRSKLKRLLRKGRKPSSLSDSSGELPGFIAVGQKGTEVLMTFETDGETCKPVFTPVSPSSGELGSGGAQDIDESRAEKSGMKKMQDIMVRMGRKAHTVSSAISKMSPSKKRSYSGKSLGEIPVNVVHGETLVPEASSSTGELTGDKEVLLGENTAGTKRQVKVTNDIAIGEDIHEPEAETDNLFEVPVASPIFAKNELTRAHKFRRVEGFRDAGSSTSSSAEEPIHPSSACLAPIKEEAHIFEEAHHILGKMRANCWTAVSTVESLTRKKVPGSTHGLTRSPKVVEASVNTPASPGTSSSTALHQRCLDSHAPECVATEQPSQAEEAFSASEPALVHGDCHGIKSCNSVPLEDGGEADTVRSSVKISTDDPETSRPSEDSTPIPSPSSRKDSPKTQGGVRRPSAKSFFSRVTAFKDEGIRRPLSSKESSSITTACFPSDTNGSWENSLNTAAPPRDEGNTKLKSPELPSEAADALLERQEETPEARDSTGGSLEDSTLSISSNSVMESSDDTGASACITSTSSVSGVGKNDDDEISSDLQQLLDTLTLDGLLVNEYYPEPTALINADDETSSVVEVSRSRTNPPDNSSFPKTHGLSSNALLATEDSSLFAPEENESEVSTIVTSTEEKSSEDSDLYPLPENEIPAECLEDVHSGSIISSKSIFPTTELALVTEASSVYNREEVLAEDEVNVSAPLSEASSSDSNASSSTVECPIEIPFSSPPKFLTGEESSPNVSSTGNSSVPEILPSRIAALGSPKALPAELTFGSPSVDPSSLGDPISVRTFSSTELAHVTSDLLGSGTEDECSTTKNKPCKDTTSDVVSSIIHSSSSYGPGLQRLENQNSVEPSSPKPTPSPTETGRSTSASSVFSRTKGFKEPSGMSRSPSPTELGHVREATLFSSEKKRV